MGRELRGGWLINAGLKLDAFFFVQSSEFVMPSSVSLILRGNPLPRRDVLRCLGSAGLLGAFSGCAVNVPKTITPVTGFDIQKFTGTWFEIARIDNKYEQGLSHVSATYELNSDGTLRVTNKGYSALLQAWKATEGKARFLSDPRVAALKVTFFSPVYSGFNIVAIDTNYQVAMVVGENLDFFWILARRQTVEPAVLQHFLQQAMAMGVDTAKIMMVAQH